MSGRVNSFLMILFRNFVLSLWAGGLVFFFSPQAPAYMGNVCLHPLEQMALFSGGAKGSKSSYKSQIRRLNKSIRAIDRRIDKQKDKLKEATDALGNSLSGRRLGDDSDDVADSVTGYIQDEQNGWDCQELLEANNFLYPPSFLPGIFGSLLPLIWETAPVYAVASPKDRRKGTVAYQQSVRENTCKKSGGTVTSTGPRGSGGKTCDCSGFGKGARSDGNWSCVCPFRPGVSLPCKQVKKLKEARKKRLEEERRQAREKARDKGLEELAKSRKKTQITGCKKKFPGFIVTGMKNNKCLCDWKSVEPKRQGNALCEYIQGHQGRKALRNCKTKYRGLDVVEAIFRGPQNKYSQCMCRWDGPGDQPLLFCNELKKIKKGVQSRQAAQKTCRSIYGSSVTRVVPNAGGPECYCGGKNLCSTVYNKCKTTYGDFKSLGKKNACMCLSKDSSGRSADVLKPCRYKKKPILPALQKCKEKYSDLKVVGGNGQGSALKCDCFYNGKTDSCENTRKQLKKQKAMQTCRKTYGSIVTGIKSTGEGPECYCGGKKLCSTIYNQCKSTYGKKFTHIDSENDCMCGSELCKDKALGGKLQQCINKNKDIYPSGVTVKKNGTCICGNQTCDELRRSKISSCKQYESLGYTEFKNGHCMCGNQKCKDKKKPQKSVDPKCFKKFKGLVVIEGLDTPAGLKCRCLHKGKRVDCDKVQKKKTVDPKCFEKFPSLAVIKSFDNHHGLQCQCLHKGKTASCDRIQIQLNQTRCLNQYGKHLRNGVKKITFKRGRCYCDNKLCGSLGDPATPPAPVRPEEPPVTVPDPVDEKSPNKQCREKYTGLKVVGAKKNGDVLDCTCYYNKKKDSCENIKKLIQATPDPVPPIPDPVDEKSPNKQCREKYTGLKVVGAKKNGDVLDCTCYYNRKKDSCENIKKLIQATPDLALPIPVGEGSGAGDESPGEGGAVEEVAQDTKEPCKRWQKKKYFKRKGRVKDRSFCSDFASSKKDCGDALEDIRDQIEKLRKLKVRRKKLEKSLSEFEDKKFDAQFSDDEDEDDTEASGFCTKCLADLRKATGPTGWQRFGSGLSIALGGTLSAVGLQQSRLAQNSTNELLALQGMPAENNFGYSLAGLSMGYPFIKNGIEGLTRGNTSSFACNRQASPYPHPYPTYPVF